MSKIDKCWLREVSGIETFFASYGVSSANYSSSENAETAEAAKAAKVTETAKAAIKETIISETQRLLNAKQQASKADAQLIFELKSSAGLVEAEVIPGAFEITQKDGKIYIAASAEIGLLYGLYELIRRINCRNSSAEASSTGVSESRNSSAEATNAGAQKSRVLNADISCVSVPRNYIRMLNHWDNFDGTIERGYAGRSIFFDSEKFINDNERIESYARLLASVGINAVSINNVNVKRRAVGLLREPHLNGVKNIADIFSAYGIKLFLAVNFASPVILGDTETADPLNDSVKNWWKQTADEIFKVIPGFGGFIVKADSEGEPGPFTYGRSHADGANMLAQSLAPHNALLIWRCFVYNCNQDWRDRKTDRARAAYDNFTPLNGMFAQNAALQIKNGPMDFQIREPVHPLFGALPQTNSIIEFQPTQEYTGQQKHICYLVPLWKEALDFNTHAPGKDKTVAEIVGGKYNCGVSGVVNVGADFNLTGHKLAQANLYGYGRLCWNPYLSSGEILTEWIRQSFALNEEDEKILFDVMADSRLTYEKYTSPLGVGWMIKPAHHYGPDVDGYEYDRWGTYHFADRDGIGVDRTTASGTAYSGTYHEPNASIYDSLETCPDELLLFFHHVPYTFVLKSGKTVIQHIYDTHFEGFERVLEMKAQLKKLEGKIPDCDYINITERINEQERSAREWRDQINTYFYRKSGIGDKHGRKIY
ncbi:MAG: alpha-glucuronidase [Clostridiales bacterium]|jgi:alpha-glucuronidase|nr:alpha-glucuronidase [Clostridiales bacterium]